MFGARRRKRPVLLILVYGIFMVIVGVTVVAQTVLVAAHFSTATLNSAIGADAALVRLFVTSNIAPEDLAAQSPDPARIAEIEARLGLLVERGKILHVEIRRPDGTIVASNEPGQGGSSTPASADFAGALTGESATATISEVAASEAGVALPTDQVLREYFPLVTETGVLAVIGVWRDAAPILAQLDTVRSTVILVTLSAGIIAAIVLSVVFRSAQGRITRQTEALVEASRRDTLTDTLNHGALVEVLAEAVDHARADGSGIAVAVVDIDNFRSLNDEYGHEAGDTALLTLVDQVRTGVSIGWSFGRSGPDEVILIAPGDGTAQLRSSLEALRTNLAEHSLQFAASERLPLTVSAGLAVFPDHADSATGLLAAAAQALQEAKTSGGDAIAVAGRADEVEPDARTFDVFQGLILAVDTKDRYTKRHSEDVARYGVFLGQQLGLDEDALASIRVAGLLHDVGKIGVPDHILRKPGRLSADEYTIIQQHVALGDAIVRDLPDIERIREGIRHHHERWDGNGYLHRLEGEAIPLIGRILAVGDAFSAMTTSRPYRKALPLEEALRRLEDAAGWQLEERLVVAFVQGIETAPDAPLPGADAHGLRLWTPYSRVA